MVTETKDQGSEGGFRLFGALLPYFPSLILRLGGSLLRLKSDAKKAGRIFQKELLSQGIDEETATEFTEMYLQPSNIKQYMGLFR